MHCLRFTHSNCPAGGYRSLSRVLKSGGGGHCSLELAATVLRRVVYFFFTGVIREVCGAFEAGYNRVGMWI